MNIFGWLSTGRAFARPDKMRGDTSGARPDKMRGDTSGARPDKTRAPFTGAYPETKSSGGTAQSYLPLARSTGISAIALGMPGVGTGTSRLSAIGSPPADYATQVRGAYLSNAVAQRACRMVAEALAGAPLKAANPAVLQLVQSPSAGQNLLETLATHMMLHGNAYVQILRADPAWGQQPASGPAPLDVATPTEAIVAELYAPRPDRIRIETDRRGWPTGFQYRASGNAAGDVQRMPLAAPDGRPLMAHIRRMHPLDDHYGLGALSSAYEAVALHNAAAAWNLALLKNAARPSGALLHDGGDAAMLSDDQFSRLRAELEAGFSGGANAGRPLLLEGGLKWQAMSMTPADMDFAGLRDAAAREIAMAFGVPPMLLGLPGDATYANYKEASRALWRLTILPMATRMLDSISTLLAPYFPDAGICVDVDRITELSEDRERLWSQIGAADFLTIPEKRQLLGLDMQAAPLATADNNAPNSSKPEMENDIG
jgi:HK97 family phage portal protein